MNFAQLLDILLAEMKIRPADLAKILGCHRSMITNYRHKKRFPTAEILARILVMLRNYNFDIEFKLVKNKSNEQTVRNVENVKKE